MEKKMSVKTAYYLFQAAGMIENARFEECLADAGYRINRREVSKMRGEAAIVIAEDAFKKFGIPTSVVLTPLSEDPGR